MCIIDSTHTARENEHLQTNAIRPTYNWRPQIIKENVDSCLKTHHKQHRRRRGHQKTNKQKNNNNNLKWAGAASDICYNCQQPFEPELLSRRVELVWNVWPQEAATTTKYSLCWLLQQVLGTKVSRVLAAVASAGSSFHSLRVLGRNKNCPYSSWSNTCFHILIMCCISVFRLCGAQNGSPTWRKKGEKRTVTEWIMCNTLAN